MSRERFRSGLRFSRSLSDAFPDVRASAIERPAPRSLLASRALWIGAAAGWFALWLIVRAAVWFWREVG